MFEELLHANREILSVFEFAESVSFFRIRQQDGVFPIEAQCVIEFDGSHPWTKAVGSSVIHQDRSILGSYVRDRRLLAKQLEVIKRIRAKSPLSGVYCSRSRYRRTRFD